MDPVLQTLLMTRSLAMQHLLMAGSFNLVVFCWVRLYALICVPPCDSVRWWDTMHFLYVSGDVAGHALKTEPFLYVSDDVQPSDSVRWLDDF